MDEREEIRKIQFTGKSSYIVSLPKQWILELGLKKGDQLRMVRKGSSTLELYPPKFETRLQKKEDATIEIEMDEKVYRTTGAGRPSCYSRGTSRAAVFAVRRGRRSRAAGDRQERRRRRERKLPSAGGFRALDRGLEIDERHLRDRRGVSGPSSLA